MIEVPKDVITEASKLADIYGDGRQGYAAFDIAVFAILAERERCASIVENFASGRGVSAEAVKARKLPSQTSVLMAQLIRGEA